MCLCVASGSARFVGERTRSSPSHYNTEICRWAAWAGLPSGVGESDGAILVREGMLSTLVVTLFDGSLVPITTDAAAFLRAST